ncbi:MAG: YraN family protein [Treponema sp.]|jgi:putative endonuclease|nr:YraN family protein [Treponema sp.]
MINQDFDADRCDTDRYSANRCGRGKKGEDQAASALETAGMEIITRNFRSKTGEIDIIARDGETIVFVEVKAWSVYGLEDLRYGIDKKKQNKIIKTAKYFLSENRKYNKMAIRFDVVFVNNSEAFTGSQITHLASAFMERV